MAVALAAVEAAEFVVEVESAAAVVAAVEAAEFAWAVLGGSRERPLV